MKNLKYLLIPILIIGFTDKISGQEIHPQLNGNVKMMIRSMYHIFDHSKTKEDIEPVTVRTYKYCENGKVESQSIYIPNKKNTEYFKYKYIYNSNKIIKKVLETCADTITLELEYFYKDNKLIKSQFERKVDIFIYNIFEQYNYDDKDFIKTKTSKGSRYNIKTKSIQNFDIKTHYYDKNKFIYKTIIHDSNTDELLNTLVYKRDKNGNMLEMNSSTSEISIIKSSNFKYEFDKEGNWIKSVEIIKGLKTIIEREITYW